MTNADRNVTNRLLHGTHAVNTRTVNNRTLYQDLVDLLDDYKDLVKAVAHLSAVVRRGE